MYQDIVETTVALHIFCKKGEKALPESQRKYCPTGFNDGEDSSENLILGLWRGLNTLAPKSIARVDSNNYSRNPKLNRDI